jgi:hypothetical protein
MRDGAAGEHARGLIDRSALAPGRQTQEPGPTRPEVDQTGSWMTLLEDRSAALRFESPSLQSELRTSLLVPLYDYPAASEWRDVRQL